MTRTRGEIKTAILGAGRMARGVSKVLQTTGQQVRLFARDDKKRKALCKDVGAIEASSWADAVKDADLIFVAVPAGAVAEVIDAAATHLTGDQVVMHACRGFCEGTLVHKAIQSVSGVQKIAVLGGPLHLDDMHTGNPLAGVLASQFDEAYALVSRLVEKTPLRLHRSHDLAGVEVAGAFSNISLIVAGMAEALEMGDTVHGLVLTHGLDDAAHLGRFLGASYRTFAGLAGVGDMIPRRVASIERHRQLGTLLASGKSLDQALAKIEGCIEGLDTLVIAQNLAKEHRVTLAVCDALEKVLAGGDAKDALETLLKKTVGLGGLRGQS